MANPDAKGHPEPPPNLRMSKDEQRECDTCTHYDSGRCELYPAVGHVDGEWVCDDWEAADPKDLKSAAAKARQVFSDRRKASSKASSDDDGDN